MVVLNAEPLGYSVKAMECWKQKGYTYMASGWDEIMQQRLLGDVNILITRLAKKIDGRVLDKFPSLTHLVSATTGLDHVDLTELNIRNIKLVSLRGQDAFLKTIPSTAEHTWALLLALIRNIPAANEHVKQGLWERDRFRGYQLKGKTIGIIGLGRTGTKVASYARAFDMDVCYFDPFVYNSNYTRCDTLSGLLPMSDIVSIHVHLNADTQNLVAAHNTGMMKDGCLLINTSRGKIVDEEAVAQALATGKISGIATDVLAGELDDIKLSPLWMAQQKNHNIIITPHIGGATYDAMWACEEFIAELV